MKASSRMTIAAYLACDLFGLPGGWKSKMRVRYLLFSVCGFAIASLVGCSGQPSRIAQINADPTRLAKCLIELGDKDGNRSLSRDELKSLPFLECMASAYDQNGDGQLTEEEITTRLASVVFDPRIAMTPGECFVQRNGKPFAGANVRLVPVSCLGDYLPMASGTAGRDGIVRLSMEAEHRPGNAPRIAGLIRPGLYRIEVTHPSISVPPRFNQQTTLGAEASSAALISGPIVINLEF